MKILILDCDNQSHLYVFQFIITGILGIFCARRKTSYVVSIIKMISSTSDINMTLYLLYKEKREKSRTHQTFSVLLLILEKLILASKIQVRIVLSVFVQNRNTSGISVLAVGFVRSLRISKT